MIGGYFDELMLRRQLLVWALATRLQLGRWEPLVAANLSSSLRGNEFPGHLIWQAESEHHFLLIAARNLVRALDLAKSDVAIDETIRSELIEGRDLHEHWPENLPIFNVTPRPQQPKHRSGRDFAARNPDQGPFSWLSWDSVDGPMVLPNVPASTVHDLADAVWAAVISEDPALSRFVPEPIPSPWLGVEHGEDRWWPKPPV